MRHGFPRSPVSQTTLSLIVKVLQFILHEIKSLQSQRIIAVQHAKSEEQLQQQQQFDAVEA